MAEITPTLIQHFLSIAPGKCLIDPATDCHEWQGALNQAGYGRISFKGRSWFTHRLAYTARSGAIPDGLVIDHLCRNHRCCNPEHLEPVTSAENSRRGIGPQVAKLRYMQQTHCKRGHPLFGKNVLVKGGWRHCRTCIKIHQARYRDANREERRRRDRIAARQRYAARKAQGKPLLAEIDRLNQEVLG